VHRFHLPVGGKGQPVYTFFPWLAHAKR
jgi:hypothetical protein